MVQISIWESLKSPIPFQIIRRLWFSKISLKNRSQMAFIRSKKRITTMVLVVSVIYVICWVPTLMIYFLANVLPSESMYSVLHKITIVLATFNSSINPVVYSLRSQQFRQNLYRLVWCDKKKPTSAQILPLHWSLWLKTKRYQSSVTHSFHTSYS